MSLNVFRIGIEFCSNRKLSSVLCDDLDGCGEGAGREVQEGRDICIHIADSLCCTAN